MEEVEDEPLFCERVAGIDIGKKMIMVTIRVQSESRKTSQGLRCQAAGLFSWRGQAISSL
jgi:hypothetical protein